jgi:arylsulfatase
VDGKEVGQVRVPRTMPFMYSADEGVDVGMDNETPVTEDYKQHGNKFTGKIVKVTIETGEAKLSKSEVARANEVALAALR